MTQANIDLSKDEDHNKKDHPISSREKIYALVDKPLTFRELLDLLPDPQWADSALHKRILAMARDKQFVIDGDMVRRKEPTKLITERVLAKGGDLYVVHEGYKIVLTERHAQGLFPNDEVILRVPETINSDSIAILVSINTASAKHIICVVKYRRNKPRLVPFDQRIKQAVVMKGKLSYPENTVLRVKRAGKQRSRRMIEVVEHEILGDVHQPHLERAIAKDIFALNDGWSEEISSSIDNASQEQIDLEAKDRESWEQMPFVTIDGEDAKDYDDAVYAEKTDSGYRLFVAIADVSHYVKQGTALDLAARQRGNSVYLPGYVIPMLPEVLSNGACSLLPEVKRLAMGCVIDLDTSGKRVATRLVKTVIKSHARLTYHQVDRMLSGKESVPEWFKTSLKHLDEVAKVLRQYRVNQGTLIIRSHETKFEFDSQGEVAGLTEVDRVWPHQLIEECMLCANMAVGSLMHEKGRKIIYRSHSEPTGDKVKQFQDYLSFHGIALPDDPTPKDLQAVIDATQDFADSHAIEMMVLRTMSQAFYSADSISHYALSTSYYTHFTSPIRRYVDLTVHREICLWLSHEAEDETDIGQIASDCSIKERSADEASWFAQAWLKSKWAEQYVGQEFSAKIVTITHFGMFVALENQPVEGLVHISELGKEYFSYNEETMTLQGQTSGRVFSLGDSVLVVLKSVDLPLQRVDFAVVDR
ncbi:MAG: VacB/RNase II family 3'-5' exoribonuclease [Pseudomonadota bacterium]|nr:VacB/RNase II family 3'-5' exoribonuclease [Pseudomonadota bacterium]